MNISAIAIRRPVFTVMVTAAIFILGVMGLKDLGTDLFPDVSVPVVTVSIVYPGAGPKEVENLVTRKIEDAVVGINGIDRLKSFSREGQSQTVVMFKLGVDVSDAATQVRERVAGARYLLPPEVKEPNVLRLDISATPILIYTVLGNRPLSELRKFADDVMKPTLEQVDGVASVEIKGGAEREFHVDVDRARLDALGLDLATVSAKLKAANLTVPAGHFDEGTREVSVRTVGELENVQQVRDVIVATAKDGSSVRLSDIARVEDSFEEQRQRVRANGQEAVSFQVLKQSGTNTVAVSDAVVARIASMQKDFPAGMQVKQIFIQAKFIKENAHEVEVSIVYGGAMAILIILVFMLDLRSTLISAVALPTSVIGTFFIMYVLGYTLNMMTLLGLSLAIGLLIDDAVVVRENIFKHLEQGKDPFTAALDGTKEIALSVLATTMTIVAVFLPIAFVKGMAGQFFRQFGIVVSGATVLSLFVAFTLDPMLSSRFSKPIVHGQVDRFARIKKPFLTVFESMDRGYRGILEWALSHKLIVAGLALGSMVFMSVIGGLVGNEFVTSEDRGQFTVTIELPAGTSLDESSRLSGLAEQEFRKRPEVQLVYATIGVDNEINKVAWRVVTLGKTERKAKIGELKDAARTAATNMIPGAKISVTDPSFVEGAATEAPIMIDIRGNDYGDIVPVAEEVERILKHQPRVQDVLLKYSPGRPELRVEVDRGRAADKGVGVAQIATAVRAATEGEEATKIRIGKDDITTRVRLGKGDRLGQAELAAIPLQTPKGRVTLSDVATFQRGEGPQVIEREDRMRQVVVWGAPRGRALADIVADLKPKLDAVKMPQRTRYDWDGQVRMMFENNSAVGVALLLAVLFIYIVLASQFESFIHPLTIMLTLPLAFVGAILALFLTDNTMAMGTMIGMVFLMGLVTKNAILLIDRAIVRVREHGEPPLQAILEAGPERLRPILMTSAAMVLGMMPTATSNAEGSEFRAPMAVAVIGGVISSTLLSLVVVPVFYLAIENAKAWLARRRGG